MDNQAPIPAQPLDLDYDPQAPVLLIRIIRLFAVISIIWGSLQIIIFGTQLTPILFVNPGWAYFGGSLEAVIQITSFLLSVWSVMAASRCLKKWSAIRILFRWACCAIVWYGILMAYFFVRLSSIYRNESKLERFLHAVSNVSSFSSKLILPIMLVLFCRLPEMKSLMSRPQTEAF